jgi:hypothetical protein
MRRGAIGVETELIHNFSYPCDPRYPWWLQDMLEQPQVFRAAARRSTGDSSMRFTIQDRVIECDNPSG